MGYEGEWVARFEGMDEEGIDCNLPKFEFEGDGTTYVTRKLYKKRFTIQLPPVRNIVNFPSRSKFQNILGASPSNRKVCVSVLHLLLNNVCQRKDWILKSIPAFRSSLIIHSTSSVSSYRPWEMISASLSGDWDSVTVLASCGHHLSEMSTSVAVTLYGAFIMESSEFGKWRRHSQERDASPRR